MQAIKGPFVKLVRVEDEPHWSNLDATEQEAIAGCYMHSFQYNEQGVIETDSNGNPKLQLTHTVPTTVAKTVDLMWITEDIVMAKPQLAFEHDGSLWLPMRQLIEFMHDAKLQVARAIAEGALNGAD